MEFQILGPLQVTADGHPLALGGEKPQALLALLLTHAGHPVSSERLIDELWGDLPPRTAIRTLRSYVSRLRRVLEPGARKGTRLRSEGHGYAIRVEPDELDARRFERVVLSARRDVARGAWAHAAERLRGALALWRGPAALAGLENYAFARSEATRLQELRLSAIEDRLEAEVWTGRHVEATVELGRLIEQHPFRERLWAALMLALYRSGRQADALDAFRRARDLLAEELAIEPGAELRQLHHAILLQDPSLDAVNPARVPSGHMPAERTSFIGRERELAHVRALVAKNRLVTLTGVGGSGKTRLALRAVRGLADHYPDGIFWVELASLLDPRLVPQQVAAGVGVSAAESKRRGVEDLLVESLADRECLLVLDNCEHLVQAVAPLVDRLLGGCPDLRILATGRQSLAVAGEVTMFVLPLQVPPPGTEPSRSFEAIRLFLDRAEALASEPQPISWDLDAVARICRRVEGIPLAIELAAARVKVLTPAEIAARLEERLDLLAGGPRSALPRHQALRATMDWSFDLLDQQELTLLRRLSVFAGGWTRRAAEAVGGGDDAAQGSSLEVLARLVDKSLIQVERMGRATRYRMLEPVRHYAEDRLVLAEDTDRVGRRHAEFYVGLVEEGDPQLRTGHQMSWLELLDVEHANMRAALRWAIGAGEADLALRLVAALGWYWFMRGHWREAKRWLDDALRLEGGRGLLRARAIYRTGGIEIIRVSTREMPSHMQEALRICEDEGDEVGIAWCTHFLGHAKVYGRPDLHGAGRLLTEGLERFQALGDAWAVAWSKRYLGRVVDELGDHERGIRLQKEALDGFRQLGDTWCEAFSHFLLGSSLLVKGQPGEARATLEHGRMLCEVLEDNIMAAHTLRDLGILSFMEEDTSAAHTLLDKARRVLSSAGDENCTALTTMYLGALSLVGRDSWAAIHELKDALRGYESLGFREGMVRVLEWIAAAIGARGDGAQAARLIGAADSAEASIGSYTVPVARNQLNSLLAAVKHQLGEDTYESHRRQGEQMRLQDAVALALLVPGDTNVHLLKQ